MNQIAKTEEYKQTELGELPIDWDIEKFEDCLSNQKIKISKIQQLQFKKIGKYPIVDQSQELISGYWNNDDDVFASPLPVIIFGDHTRTLKFIDFPFVCGPDGTKILIPDKTKIYPQFFYYYLKLLNIPSKGYNRHYSLLKEKFIARPPLPEQQKIAYVLSTIQDDKEKTENTINSYKELKKSLMKHLFKYGPVKFEDTDKVKLKETEIGEMPEGWDIKNLGYVVRERIRDGVHKTPTYINVGVPFITAKDIIDNKVNFAECKYISSEEHKRLIKAIKPEKGDILLTKVGTVGNVALIDFVEEFSIFVQLALIKPNNQLVNTSFLKQALLSNLVQKDISDKSAQSTMKFIGVQRISTVLIPLPSLPIQQEIEETLSSVDSKIEHEENKKNALEELFKSMLYNLMSAKMRVGDLRI